MTGADQICESEAGATSGWKAILRDSAQAFPERIDIAGPIYNSTGTLVADDAAELWSGTAQAPVNFDFDGNEIGGSPLAWTGTIADNCDDWDTAVFEDLGAFGVPYQTDTWLDSTSTFQCGLGLHLLCISQP